MKKSYILFLMVFSLFLVHCGPDPLEEERAARYEKQDKLFKTAVIYLLKTNRSYEEIIKLHTEILEAYNKLIALDAQMTKKQEQDILRKQKTQELIKELKMLLEEKELEEERATFSTEIPDNKVTLVIPEPVSEESEESEKSEEEEETEDSAN